MTNAATLSKPTAGNWMIDARTTKVLGALLFAMTAGALVLMALESEPPRPDRDHLAIASGTTLDRQDWTVTHPWKRIVIHASTGGRDSLPGRCHFVIDATPLKPHGSIIRPTDLWQRQVPGHHVYVPGHDFNADSIGICLMGDFSRQSPPEAQFEALVGLVRKLQGTCGISADSVYLHSELNPDRPSPGQAFPVGTFNDRLRNDG